MKRKESFEFLNVSSRDTLGNKGIVLGQTKRKKNKKRKKIDPHRNSSKLRSLVRSRDKKNKYDYEYEYELVEAICEYCGSPEPCYLFRGGRYCYYNYGYFEDIYNDNYDYNRRYYPRYRKPQPTYSCSHRFNVDNSSYLYLRSIAKPSKKRKHKVCFDQLEFIPPGNNSTSLLELLPLEILYMIYGQLEVQDIYALSCTSKHMNDTISSSKFDIKVNIRTCPIDVCAMRVIYQMERKRKYKQSNSYKKLIDIDLYKNMLLVALKDNNMKIAKRLIRHINSKDKDWIETIYQVAYDSNRRVGKTPTIIKHIQHSNPRFYIKYNCVDLIEDDMLYLDSEEAAKLIPKCIKYDRMVIFDMLMYKIFHTRGITYSDRDRKIIFIILYAAIKYDNLNFILKYNQYIEPEVIALECANPDIDAITIFKWIWGYYKLYNDKDFLKRLSNIDYKSKSTCLFITSQLYK